MTSRVFTSELRRNEGKRKGFEKSSPKTIYCKKVIDDFVCQSFNCFLIIVKFFSDFKYNTLSKNVTLKYVCVCVCERERERERGREITVKLLCNFLGKWEAINNLSGQSLWLKSCISTFSTRF